MARLTVQRTFWQVVGEGAQAGASSEGGSSKFTVDLLDQFFKDPNMQQLLYKYLPEPMRNPQTFEWMLQNPEYRKQLEAMMEQQVSQSLDFTISSRLWLIRCLTLVVRGSTPHHMQSCRDRCCPPRDLQWVRIAVILA